MEDLIKITCEELENEAFIAEMVRELMKEVFSQEEPQPLPPENEKIELPF